MTWDFALPQHKYLNMIVELVCLSTILKYFTRLLFTYLIIPFLQSCPKFFLTIVPQIPIHLGKRISPYFKTFLMENEN